MLLHDEAQGEPLLDALARHGDGLPARVLPLRRERGRRALDLVAARRRLRLGRGRAAGAAAGRRGHGAEGLFRNLDYVGAALDGARPRRHAPPRAAAIETDDPFTLGEALAPCPGACAGAPATFLPLGTPREVARLALRGLRAAADAARARRVRDAGAGALRRGRRWRRGCTLCLACTMVCPTGAFSANPETPQLRFLEDACVQCGLCVATCPEKVITPGRRG